MKKTIIFCLLVIIGNSCSESIQDSIFDEISGGEENRIEKLNILIDNFNGFSSSSYKAYEFYIRAYGEDSKVFKKTNYSTIGQINDLYINKLDNLDLALSNNEYEALNPRIENYQITAKKLSNLNNTMYSYYEMQDYESDDFKKGKESHQYLLLAYNNFFDADYSLRNAVDSIQSINELIFIQKLKEEGKTLDYYVEMTLNSSKRMLTVAQSGDYNDLKAEDLKDINIEVRTWYDSLKVFKQNYPEEFGKNINMTWYLSALENYTKESNELFLRIKKHKSFSTGEKMNLQSSGSGWMVSGSVPALLQKYNKLVDSYNDF